MFDFFTLRLVKMPKITQECFSLFKIFLHMALNSSDIPIIITNRFAIAGISNDFASAYLFYVFMFVLSLFRTFNKALFIKTKMRRINFVLQGEGRSGGF